jgi:hypothetical protein
VVPSSSSFGVSFFFCFTNLSWFASYF